MQSALTLTQTTIGKKAVVAVTGLILFGFVIGHLAGNLILFVGPEAYIDYAWTLKHNPPLLWGTRITLLAAVVTHIALTIQIARQNTIARPTPYKHGREDQITTYAARTMVISGPLLLAYIVFHLAHFTVPGFSIQGDFNHVNVYGNLVRDFRVWWVSAIYVFANIMLGLHLFHGSWSALQSLGMQHPKYDKLRRAGALSLAMFVACGNVLIPISVQAGIIGSREQLDAAEAYADEKVREDGGDPDADDGSYDVLYEEAE
ncbi:MAG: succinate dehydrogenase cytochrome b subunit [Sandaracinaceae bacterium]